MALLEQMLPSRDRDGWNGRTAALLEMQRANDARLRRAERRALMECEVCDGEGEVYSWNLDAEIVCYRCDGTGDVFGNLSPWEPPDAVAEPERIMGHAVPDPCDCSLCVKEAA